jgi:mRNA-degrading endonuclease toxin of MazEF toxin-antitoxin module
MRSMDWQARRVAFVGRAPDEVLSEVRETIAAIAGMSFE